MNSKYVPYKFNEKKEYKTYLNISKQYIKYYKGKKINNKYPTLNKYTDWKKYFIKKFLKYFYNHGDFKHYLIAKLRINQRNLEILRAIVVPIYVALITVLLNLSDENDPMGLKLFVFFLIVFMVVFQLCMACKLDRKINFLKDCIDIVANYT